MSKQFYMDVANADWTWAEDYLYSYATYVVACPADRICQVGMGIFAFGQPRGERLRFSGEREITVVGVGALHFRVDDGKGPCRVGYARKDAKGITFSWEF